MRQFINMLERAETPFKLWPEFQASDEFLQALRHYRQGGLEGVRDVFDKDMPVLREKLTVYRGIRCDRASDLDEEFNFLDADRKILKTSRYMSTSTSLKVAREFFNRNDAPFRVMFEIETMPGAKGIVVKDFIEYYNADLDMTTDFEHEVLLDRNSKFQVIDTDG